MKPFILLLLLTCTTFVASAQFNLPVFDDGLYCNHAKAAEYQARHYYEPASNDPLLDKYDVSFYFLDLEVSASSIDISGMVTIQAEVVSSTLDTFAFELYGGMNIDLLKINGVETGYIRSGDLTKVLLQEPLPHLSTISAEITYHGTPPTGGFFSGVTNAYASDYQKNVTWTLSEPYAAKDWWPTKMELTDKADSVWVFLTTSTEEMAGSQGLLTAVTPLPGNKHRFEWKSKYPIDYYLISFAVSDYQEYNIYAFPEGAEDSILIQNFIYDHPNCLPDNKAGIDNTDEFIELFSELFGMYPFAEEKYGHCFTELGGGMEHQTMTTIGGFSFGLVAHELGHMWYGDNITCGTWSDIWINEGFATYSDYLAHSFLAGPYYDSLWLKIRHDQVKSQPGGSVYVPEEDLGDIWRIFDGRLSYSKGALLLHMIRFELQDDDMFFNVMQSYTAEFGDSTATGDDFKEWLEWISGQDFTDFFDQWYYGEGYPIFDIVWHQDGSNLSITSTQSTSTNITTLFKMKVPYHLNFSDGTDTTLILYQDANVSSYNIPISKEIDFIDLDPGQWILHRVNSLSVGVEEEENPVHFTLGPNPANDQFTVYFTNPGNDDFNVGIADMSGRTVYNKTLAGATERIIISSIPRGAYIVTVTNGTEKLNKKLIID